MPRRTKKEYEESLIRLVVARLRGAEDQLWEAYEGFLETGPKSVAKEFGEAWANIIDNLENDIQRFGCGIEKRSSREFKVKNGLVRGQK